MRSKTYKVEPRRWHERHPPDAEQVGMIPFVLTANPDPNSTI
jgi:hypothetical protein